MAPCIKVALEYFNVMSRHDRMPLMPLNEVDSNLFKQKLEKLPIRELVENNLDIALNIKDTSNLILSLEQDFDVNIIEYKNIKLWPIVRAYIYGKTCFLVTIKGLNSKKHTNLGLD